MKFNEQAFSAIFTKFIDDSNKLLSQHLTASEHSKKQVEAAIKLAKILLDLPSKVHNRFYGPKAYLAFHLNDIKKQIGIIDNNQSTWVPAIADTLGEKLAELMVQMLAPFAQDGNNLVALDEDDISLLSFFKVEYAPSQLTAFFSSLHRQLLNELDIYRFVSGSRDLAGEEANLARLINTFLNEFVSKIETNTDIATLTEEYKKEITQFFLEVQKLPPSRTKNQSMAGEPTIINEDTFQSTMVGARTLLTLARTEKTINEQLVKKNLKPLNEVAVQLDGMYQDADYNKTIQELDQVINKLETDIQSYTAGKHDSEKENLLNNLLTGVKSRRVGLIGTQLNIFTNKYFSLKAMMPELRGQARDLARTVKQNNVQPETLNKFRSDLSVFRSDLIAYLRDFTDPFIKQFGQDYYSNKMIYNSRSSAKLLSKVVDQIINTSTSNIESMSAEELNQLFIQMEDQIDYLGADGCFMWLSLHELQALPVNVMDMARWAWEACEKHKEVCKNGNKNLGRVADILNRFRGEVFSLYIKIRYSNDPFVKLNFASEAQYNLDATMQQLTLQKNENAQQDANVNSIQVAATSIQPSVESPEVSNENNQSVPQVKPSLKALQMRALRGSLDGHQTIKVKPPRTDKRKSYSLSKVPDFAAEGQKLHKELSEKNQKIYEQTGEAFEQIYIEFGVIDKPKKRTDANNNNNEKMLCELLETITKDNYRQTHAVMQERFEKLLDVLITVPLTRLILPAKDTSPKGVAPAKDTAFNAMGGGCAALDSLIQYERVFNAKLVAKGLPPISILAELLLKRCKEENSRSFLQKLEDAIVKLESGVYSYKDTATTDPYLLEKAVGLAKYVRIKANILNQDANGYTAILEYTLHTLAAYNVHCNHQGISSDILTKVLAEFNAAIFNLHSELTIGNDPYASEIIRQVQAGEGKQLREFNATREARQLDSFFKLLVETKAQADAEAKANDGTNNNSVADVSDSLHVESESSMPRQKQNSSQQPSGWNINNLDAFFAPPAKESAPAAATAPTTDEQNKGNPVVAVSEVSQETSHDLTQYGIGTSTGAGVPSVARSMMKNKTRIKSQSFNPAILGTDSDLLKESHASKSKGRASSFKTTQELLQKADDVSRPIVNLEAPLPKPPVAPQDNENFFSNLWADITAFIAKHKNATWFVVIALVAGIVFATAAAILTILTVGGTTPLTGLLGLFGVNLAWNSALTLAANIGLGFVVGEVIAVVTDAILWFTGAFKAPVVQELPIVPPQQGEVQGNSDLSDVQAPLQNPAAQYVPTWKSIPVAPVYPHEVFIGAPVPQFTNGGQQSN